MDHQGLALWFGIAKGGKRLSLKLPAPSTVTLLPSVHILTLLIVVQTFINFLKFPKTEDQRTIVNLQPTRPIGTFQRSLDFQKTGCWLTLAGEWVSHAGRQLAQSEYGRRETDCNIVYKFPIAWQAPSEQF